MNPEEMEKAIVRNLSEKTGRSIEEWFEVLNDTELSEKQEDRKSVV